MLAVYWPPGNNFEQESSDLTYVELVAGDGFQQLIGIERAHLLQKPRPVRRGPVTGLKGNRSEMQIAHGPPDVFEGHRLLGRWIDET